jgi:hypothetical protein
LVALICCETLGLEGAAFCRGYVQHWLKTEKEISTQSAARIFAAASSILKAGTPAGSSQPDSSLRQYYKAIPRLVDPEVSTELLPTGFTAAPGTSRTGSSVCTRRE